METTLSTWHQARKSLSPSSAVFQLSSGPPGWCEPLGILYGPGRNHLSFLILAPSVPGSQWALNEHLMG